MDKRTRRIELLEQMTRKGVDGLLLSQLTENLDQLRERIVGKIVGGYIPLPGEPELNRYFQDLSSDGTQMALPYLQKGVMRYAAWQPGQEIMCDANHCLTGKELRMVKPEILLVPFVGFTVHGYRLGRGKGLFDQYLAQHPDTMAIGVGFSYQQTDFLPEPHDKALSYIVTEQEILSF